VKVVVARKSTISEPRADKLKEYVRKRDFNRTTEPKPRRAKGAGWQFVVQKHDARIVHYDLRLEFGGTLKSWALTKGPSLIVGEKRLAVRTEDHPLQYLEFEGNIPEGEYGAGAMIVWDRGRWDPSFDPEKGLQKGHLDISLYGKRLKGRWHLVRMRTRPGEKKENWLFIKADDEFARHKGQTDITDEETKSYLSGRTTEELAAHGELRKDHAGRVRVIKARKRAVPNVKPVRGARKGILPAFLEPSLPQITQKAPSGPKWVHEIKYDGYRMQARIDGRDVKLLTRKGLNWTARFPSIVAALKKLGLSSALLDGEIVVEEATGVPSFNLLQADLKAGRHDRFRYFLFDLLYCEGFDLTQATLLDRKALLQEILAGLSTSSPIRFSEHLEQDGPTMFEHACRLGLEGIISKRIDVRYRPGRGEHWLKTKGILRQEFVILGYIPSTSAKGSVGSLVLGLYERESLQYVGRVGTGFSAEQARSLRKELERIATTKPKLGQPLPAGADKGVRWAEPRLVCEVEYRGWTEGRLIRQASFKGIREDRPAEEITLETAPGKPVRDHDRELIRRRLTHPERILWPERGVTKEGLAEFYSAIAVWILPHISGRVLSLVRCPSGVDAKCFFAKHVWRGLSDTVQRVDVGEKEPMLGINNLSGLIDLVQANVVEIHPWGSTISNLEKPDRLIFDLDPGEDVPWSAVVSAAIEVRDRLNDFGLKSFVKTSGGKGLHVALPIEPTAAWDAAKEFTKSIAEMMAEANPERYVTTMTKKARKGRIFIDYLRNGRGATAVAAYSTRALPEATVSTPLGWDELSEAIRANHFTIDNLRHRFDALKKDPWASVSTIKQTLPQMGKFRA
jgi:bifunctional non-homologous end joining protein LigD